MKQILNPILRGFNPDPSIIRVENDYFIATSTFEWFPGVQIHHSRDLIHWQLIARPLNRLSQLYMMGNPDSCGVWAPCLSYDKGKFYLVYSNVRSFDGVWKDTPNYLVTSTDISGSWSDPIFLSSRGFDGSLFHDEDGKKWYTSMQVDHRGGEFFGGIILQEYDPLNQKLTGPVYPIFSGTELGITEAPHLYKIGPYYYLITAEGGTEYGHAVTLARATNLTGPYEVHPHNPLVTARDYPEHPLQKAGHADWVQSPEGDWYIVFLTGRPLTTHGRCILGRETAIEQVEWRENGWPYLPNETQLPRTHIEIKDTESYPFLPLSVYDSFDSPELNIHFQSLRIPISENWCSLTKRPGFLRLYGRESLSSLHRQSLIARRLQHFHAEVSTCVEFSPKTFQQMAGLVAYYNTCHFHYLHITSNDDGTERLLQIISCDKYEMSEPLSEPVAIPAEGPIYLNMQIHREQLQFRYALEKDQWIPMGPVLDASILSDDYVRDEQNRYRPAFTGMFVGMCCQDLTGQKLHADFDWFDYRELES